MLETVEIPEGEFLMGCESGAANERPLHTVRLDRFAIARFPVTNRLFNLFIDELAARCRRIGSQQATETSTIPISR
jgi:formylglycine-generating enzyme required for sulfatase activity